jgi:hypothetical protein
MRVWKLQDWDGSHISTDAGTYATPAVAVSALVHHVGKMYGSDRGVMFRLTSESALEFETRGDSVTLKPDHVIGTDPDPVLDVVARQSLRWIVRRVMAEVYGPAVLATVDQWRDSGAVAATWRV